MAVDLSGKWKLDRDEHFDDYLKEIGMPYMSRIMASQATAVMDITQDGNDFSIATQTLQWFKNFKFTVGKEFECEAEGTLKVNKLKCLATWDGSKLVVKTEVISGDAKNQTTIREIVDGELVVTLIVNDVTCKRIFKRC